MPIISTEKITEVVHSNLFKGLSWTFVAQIIGNLLRFLLVFIVVRCYTKEEFGLWASITSIAAIIVTGDFGLTNVLRNIASEEITKGEEGDKHIKESWLSAVFFLVLFAVIGILVLLFLSQFSFFEALFKTDDQALRAMGKTVILVVLAIFLLNLPFSIAAGMLLSYGEIKEYSLFSMLGGALTFIVVIALSICHIRIDIVSIAYFSCSLIVSIITTLFFVKKRKWSAFRMPVKDMIGNLRPMLLSGIGFLGIGMSSSFLSNVLTIFSGSLLGLSAAANINIAQKIYAFFSSIIVGLFNPIWAKLAQFYYGQEYNRCKKLLDYSILGTLLVSLFIIVLVILLRQFLVLIVAGPEYEIDAVIFLLVGGCLFAKVVFDNASLLLVATSQLKVVFWGYMAFSALVLFVFPKLMDLFGFNRMLIVLIICWAAFISIVYSYSRKLLRK